MKQLIAFILILLIVLQPFCGLWVYTSFKINQEYIAETLCVKKEIKGNCCQGRCYLKTKLAQSEKEEQKNIPQGYKLKAEVLYYFSQTSFDIFKFSPNSHAKKQPFYECGFYTFNCLSDIFRPPQFNLI